MKRLVLILALLTSLVALSFAVQPASAHGCHHYCAWMWADDGSGGGAWCGEDHNGDIYYRWNGAGYRCNWNNCCHPSAPLHDGYWTSGYRIGIKPKPHDEHR